MSNNPAVQLLNVFKTFLEGLFDLDYPLLGFDLSVGAVVIGLPFFILCIKVLLHLFNFEGAVSNDGNLMSWKEYWRTRK